MYSFIKAGVEVSETMKDIPDQAPVKHYSDYGVRSVSIIRQINDQSGLKLRIPARIAVNLGLFSSLATMVVLEISDKVFFEKEVEDLYPDNKQFSNFWIYLNLYGENYEDNQKFMQKRIQDIFETRDMRIQMKSNTYPDDLNKYYSSGGKGDNHDPVGKVYYIPKNKETYCCLYIDHFLQEKNMKFTNNQLATMNFVEKHNIYVQVVFPQNQLHNWKKIQHRTEKILDQIVVDVVN